MDVFYPGRHVPSGLFRLGEHSLRREGLVSEEGTKQWMAGWMDGWMQESRNAEKVYTSPHTIFVELVESKGEPVRPPSEWRAAGRMNSPK